MASYFYFYLVLFASCALMEWRLRSWQQSDQRSVQQRVDRTSWVKVDPEASARIRKYAALTMVERYGEHGP